MLLKLNERIQGVIAWVVIVLIATTFTLFGVDYYLQSHQASNVKALVNDKPINERAFDVNYRRSRAQLALSSTPIDEKALQAQVLDQMIANEVTVQAAQRVGFDVSVNQANAAIVNIPQFQEDGHFSSQRYQQALSNALFTAETFQNEVKQGMLLNQQRFAFMASSFVLSEEIKRFVNLYMQTRDYDYTTISPLQFEKQVTISSDEIQSYYNLHKNDFLTPEQVSVDYLTLSTKDIKSQIKITDEDVKRHYDENKNNFLTPAQWKVAHILFAIPQGASASDIAQIEKKAETTYELLEKKPDQFNDFVKKLSDDKLSVADNGVLPWIVAGNKDYDTILSNLTQRGQISKPEKTKFGYEIFKLVDYKPVITKSLNEVAETIKEQLTADMTQAKYAQALEQLSDLSYQVPDSLAAASDALKIKIKKTELFSRQGGSTPITQNKLAINAAFNRDVLELGNNSEVIQLDNDSVIVLRVNEHQLAKEKPFKEVHDTIKNELSKKKAEELAKKKGSDLINVDDKKQADLTSSNSVKWHKVTKASRDQVKDNQLINELAFSLLKPGSRGGISLPNGEYAVVSLKQINNGDFNALDKEQQDSLIQHIESNFGIMDYDLYVNDLIRNAQIVKH